MPEIHIIIYLFNSFQLKIFVNTFIYFLHNNSKWMYMYIKTIIVHNYLDLYPQLCDGSLKHCYFVYMNTYEKLPSL